MVIEMYLQPKYQMFKLSIKVYNLLKLLYIILHNVHFIYIIYLIRRSFVWNKINKWSTLSLEYYPTIKTWWCEKSYKFRLSYTGYLDRGPAHTYIYKRFQRKFISLSMILTLKFQIYEPIYLLKNLNNKL